VCHIHGVRRKLTFTLVAGIALVWGAGPAPAEMAYPLDTLPRQTASPGRASCPDVPMKRYAGSIVPFHKPSRIYVGFERHLRGFEEIVRDTAIEVYGRAPRRLRHAGTYACRHVRGYATLLSEHALGNAIDVEGFDFGPAPRGAGGPRALRGAFSVRLGRHWNGTGGAAAVHSRFLRLLAERTIARPDLFRVVLGPSYPGHAGHFHLDLAPYRLVDVFGDDAR
jgi:hypothetical protein